MPKHFIFQNQFNVVQLERTLKYFSELPTEIVDKLFDVYDVDFQMFDFDRKPFMKKVEQTSTSVV